MTKKEEREYLFNKYGGRCSYCGCELGERWHADHKEPVIRLHETRYDHEARKYKTKFTRMENPENDTLENKTPACISCNINKHAMNVEQFRAFIQRFINSLNNNVCYKVAKRYGLIQETGIQVKFYFETYQSEASND